MGRKHDIFGTNRGKEQAGYTTEAFKPKGRPAPREATSQKAQLASGHRLGTDKGFKVPINKKIGHHSD